MKEYRVVRLRGGVDPVSSDEIEQHIGDMTRQGWHFLQLSTGGGGSASYFMTWVYLIFERET